MHAHATFEHMTNRNFSLTSLSSETTAPTGVGVRTACGCENWHRQTGGCSSVDGEDSGDVDDDTQDVHVTFTRRRLYDSSEQQRPAGTGSISGAAVMRTVTGIGRRLIHGFSNNNSLKRVAKTNDDDDDDDRLQQTSLLRSELSPAACSSAASNLLVIPKLR